MLQKFPPLNAIVAMAQNHVIGLNNSLPWHVPADLKHFKTITTGHVIIMGRKTFESIGKPLPDRKNIILTRNKNFQAQNCSVVNDLNTLAKLLAQFENQKIFVIGGAEIYAMLMPYIHKIYLTLIHANFDGDTFFSELDVRQWQEVRASKHQSDENNDYDYSFIELERC